MNPEQLTALIATIVGAPFLIELVKKWFEGRNLNLQTSAQDERTRDEREWRALETALERERQIYSSFIAQQRVEFSERLTTIEARLATIQEEALRYQKLYWEERVQRERLQARVEFLEAQLHEVEKKTS